MKKFTLLMAAALMGMSASAATVYWDNTETGWSEVIGYSWQPDVNETLTATTVAGHEVYAITLDNEEIIFKGASAWSDDMQTANLAVVDGYVYGKGSIKSNGGSIDPIATIIDGVWKEYSAPVDEYPAMYMVGTMTGWSTSANYKMATTDGITYTLEHQNFTTTDQFKFYGGSWGTRELTTSASVSANTPVELSSGSDNITVSGDITDATVKLVVNSDYTLGTLTLITSGPGPQPVGPEHVYLIGNVNGTGWSTSASPEMTKEGDLYKITDVTIDDAGEGFGYISMITRLASDWDGDETEPGVNSSDRFGAPAANTVLELSATETTSAPVTLSAAGVNASSANSWKIAAGNKYAFTFNYPEMTLTVTKTSGVEAIEAEEGNAVYYNLQGVRVDNPENGIFIRVANGKSVKVAK